ncbi:hypothetical protein AnigIFM60653_009083 [Aspergillus niger]|nr:hypothetical protein AnigIFM60653_009083 [Aspergillus niger]
MTAPMSATAAARADWRAIAICLFITIAAFQFGFDSSYYSGILVMEPFIKAYGHYDNATGGYVLSSSIQSLTTSIINVGELVGAVSSYLVDDRIGRRGGLFVSSTFVVLGVIFQVSADKLALLIVGRLLLADCAPARFRGALVSLYQFDVGLGLLLGVIVDNATKNRNDSGAYRIPMAVQLVLPVILVPGLILFAPESPRWLLKKGKTEQARAALRRLHGNRPDVIESEVLYISGTIEEERRAEGSWRELLHWHQDGRKAYLGMALQGMTNSFLIQMGLYLVPMPAVWLNQYCVERFGRRPMLLLSCVLVAIVLLIVGGAGTASHKTTTLDRLIVAMVYIYMIVYNLSLGPAVWVVTSEISAGPNRSKLMATSTGVNWFCSWMVTFTFPYLFDSDAANLSARVGFIYGSLMVAAAVWIYFLLPETSGRTLEEIQVLFKNGVSAWNFKSYEIPEMPGDSVLDEKREAHATEVEEV